MKELHMQLHEYYILKMFDSFYMYVCPHMPRTQRIILNINISI